MKTNRLILALGAALLAAGCDREAGIRTYKAPKDPSPPAVAVANTGGGIQWTAPTTWKPIAPGSMTNAAYQVSENPPLKMTVSEVTLTGSPSQTLLANVNRWNGQLGLPPAAEADLPKIVTPIKIDGRDSHMIDLSGPNPAPDGTPARRMLAALVPDTNKMWAFKLFGPAEWVTPHKDEFDEMVKSVNFGANASAPAEASTDTTPTPSAAGAPKIDGITSFTLPEGWQLDPTPRQMRQGTIVVRSGNAQGEVVITRFGASSLSDLTMNLNRWRGQVHLPPAADPAANPPQEFSFAQGPGLLRDFVGPDADGNARLRQVVAYTQFSKADSVWFFRFVGPHDLVTRSKPAFDAFVKSVKFDDK